MWKDCQALQDEITALRRELHQIPEVGAQLPETAACLSAHLDRLGIPFVRSPRDSGLIASIQGGLPGRTVALRADMDALPIQEETGLPFSSRRPGVMHACGHDAHAAMLMGAAQVLQKHRKELRGTVRLLFQPAEEQCEGAKVILEQGALDGVDAIFGFHIGTLLGDDIPSGTVIAPSGCCMAAFDKFTIRVRGRGCHGSTPEKGVDPVNAAAHIVLSLQAITTREISAARSLVLTIGRIQGGDQYNIIPDEVVLEGTIRTLEGGLRQYAARRIGEVAQAAAAVFGASADCTITWGAPLSSTIPLWRSWPPGPPPKSWARSTSSPASQPPTWEVRISPSIWSRSPGLFSFSVPPTPPRGRTAPTIVPGSTWTSQCSGKGPPSTSPLLRPFSTAESSPRLGLHREILPVEAFPAS